MKRKKTAHVFISQSLPEPSSRQWSKTVRALQKKGGTIEFPKKSLEITPVEPSPCREECPAGVNVKGFVGLVAERKFREALALIRENNPFPGICGRVCDAPCEDSCNRGEYGGALAIRALERFVADWDMRKNSNFERKAKPRGKKVAVIGSGPAGLTAAWDLTTEGFRVTVFEAGNAPGGMMSWAIPTFRLPRNVVKREIKAIEAAGVEIKTNTRLGRDISLPRLKKQGYRAVFLAIGAHKPVKLKIPGENAPGVVDALPFLRKASSGKSRKPGSRVVVIGGGNSAVDAARTALRLGGQDVTVIYRRSEEEMPADPDKIRAARKEGVLFQFLVSPKKIISKNGKVSSVECIHMQLGEADDTGRKSPLPIDGSEFSLEADKVITAIGQVPDGEVLNKTKFELNEDGTVKVNPETLQTSRKTVFAGADVVTGPASVVESIAHGHLAARSITRYLRGEDLIPEKGFRKPVEMEVPHRMISSRKRVSEPVSDSHRRRRAFLEVESGLTIEDAVAEAGRCLRCGPCFDCSRCLASCPKEWIVLTSGSLSKRVYNLPIRSEKHHREIQPGGKAIVKLKISGSDESENYQFFVRSMLARVNIEICRACDRCAQVCPYDAIHPAREPVHLGTYWVDEERCKGCGACLTVCPVGAIDMGFYSPAHYMEMMKTAIEEASK